MDTTLPAQIHTSTPELTQARHHVEHSFLRMLSEQYHDEDIRKTIARHFVLYKEITLFITFAMMLKERLSDGLSDAVIRMRNELWRTMSEKFYESYTRTHNLAGTLEYVFWKTLPENTKGDGFANLVENGYLMRIFDFSRNAVKTITTTQHDIDT